MASVHDFQATDIDGKLRELADFRGRALLIVNTASRCGFTPQFEALEELYQRHRERGLEVLGFPCNQFGGQDPGSNAEIADFCRIRYGVSFPMFARVEVNGAEAHPLFRYLRTAARGLLGSSRIQWNFTKFLVDGDGRVRRRFAPMTPPQRLEAEIERLLEGEPGNHPAP